MGSTFDVRFQLLSDTIPSGRKCKTAVGRKRKCQELMEFHRTAVQLYQHADMDADRRRANELIAEVDRQALDHPAVRGGHRADAVREALGKPRSGGFGSWSYGVPAERAVRIYFTNDHRVSGWSDPAAGVNVGDTGDVAQAGPDRGLWP